MSTCVCAQLDAVLLCRSCAVHVPFGQLRPSSKQSLTSLGLTSANAAVSGWVAWGMSVIA